MNVENNIFGLATTIVRACVRRGGGGSPTAVVDDRSAATDADRLAIPGLAGTSHAAFLSQEQRADESRTVRFFTSHGELANCGHATIAAHALLLTRSGADELRTRQYSGGRTFEAVAVRRPEGIPQSVEVWFDQGIVELRRPRDDERDAVLAALGLQDRDLHAAAEATVASPGTPRYLLPVRDRAVLHSISPRFGDLAATSVRFGYLGCFVYVPPTPAQAAEARMFAPAIGVAEDVTNANSVGCLAAHLLTSSGVDAVEVDQGDALGCPGTVTATATGGPAGIRVRVGGVAVVPAQVRAPRSRNRTHRWS